MMRYPPEVTKKWLGWLAREMRQRNLTTFSLVQLQPDWLPGRHRWFYWWVYRFSVVPSFSDSFLCSSSGWLSISPRDFPVCWSKCRSTLWVAFWTISTERTSDQQTCQAISDKL